MLYMTIQPRYWIQFSASHDFWNTPPYRVHQDSMFIARLVKCPILPLLPANMNATSERHDKIAGTWNNERVEPEGDIWARKQPM